MPLGEPGCRVVDAANAGGDGKDEKWRRAEAGSLQLMTERTTVLRECSVRRGWERARTKGEESGCRPGRTGRCEWLEGWGGLLKCCSLGSGLI